MTDQPEDTPTAEELLEDSKRLSTEAHEGWQRLPYEDAGHSGLVEPLDAEPEDHEH